MKTQKNQGSNKAAREAPSSAASALELPSMIELRDGIDPDGLPELSAGSGRRPIRSWPVVIKIGRHDTPERTTRRLEAIFEGTTSRPPSIRVYLPEDGGGLRLRVAALTPSAPLPAGGAS